MFLGRLSQNYYSVPVISSFNGGGVASLMQSLAHGQKSDV